MVCDWPPHDVDPGRPPEGVKGDSYVTFTSQLSYVCKFGGSDEYSASMSAAYRSAITRRLSLSVGVSSPDSAVHSTGNSRQRRTCSACETTSLALSTARWTSALNSGSTMTSDSGAPLWPCAEAQPHAASGSSTISAVMY